MPDEEFAVFFRKDVIGDRGNVVLVAEPPAKLKHQRRLAAPNGPTDANRKGASRKVARVRKITFMEMAGMIEMFVSVAVIMPAMRLAVTMAMRM